MVLILILLLWQDPSWESVRGKIAYHESRHGTYKLHVNPDLSLDVGLYQLNTVHFSGKGKVGKEFDKIFTRYKVGKSLHERVVAAIVNDKLNEELAKKLYQLRGLKSWTSSRKFIKEEK